MTCKDCKYYDNKTYSCILDHQLWNSSIYGIKHDNEKRFHGKYVRKPDDKMSLLCIVRWIKYKLYWIRINYIKFRINK